MLTEQRNTTLSRRAGFSVAEVVIALVIFGFVMAAVFTGTITISRMFASSASTADIHRQERWLEGHVARDIRMASNILESTDEVLIERQGMADVTYSFEPTSDGRFNLVRTEDGETRLITAGVKSWNVSVEAPDPTNPARTVFQLEVTVEGVNSRGRREDRQIHASFSPRSSQWGP